MNLEFCPSAGEVNVFDFAEVAICATGDLPANPFTDVEIRAVCAPDGQPGWAVDGFCDSDDGALYRVRLMPRCAGVHRYTVTVRHGAALFTHTGMFNAMPVESEGLVQVDPEHPYHFVYSGSGAHFFYNSTTAYALAGCREDVMVAALDRLARLGINRIRAAIYGARVESGEVWGEPVYKSEEFQFLMNPWPAARPDSVEDPGFDVSRFQTAHWQKFDRLLLLARARGIQVSVIFYVDGQRPPTMYPFRETGGGPDEQRYYRYAAARHAAFRNVMWDVSNEYRLFRDDAWAETMGIFLKSCDPYGHLMSVHGFGDFRFRTSAWADYALYQSWDEFGGYDYMLKNRAEQDATGRPMPQVNEEYGYEDSYPQGWGGARVYPARATDTRRMLAWEMTLAGGYQTTGEWGGDGLGGWINGRAQRDDLLIGHRHLTHFFTSFDWWRMNPHPELADSAMCLAEPGVRYVLYLPQGGTVSLALTGRAYTSQWFNPRTGAYLPAIAHDRVWTAPDSQDWALLVEMQY
jgi:Domain of unknown function (DUF5060)